MNRLMLDFETLDVAECPVILSMGVVVFNENQIIDCFSEKINEQSCLKLGCTISKDTVAWWLKQTEKAQDDAFGGTTNIGYAMGMLVDLYKKHGCEEIWSKGAIADIRWANNILDKLGLQKPWKFWEEMCFRTYLKYSPKVDFQPVGEAHNALDDAINQAKHWIEINQQNHANFQILNRFSPNPRHFTCQAIDTLDEVVERLINIDGITIEAIEASVLKNGYQLELVTGTEAHATYAIYLNRHAHIVNITKCKCGKIHYLEDECLNCNFDLEDNFLGNGTPIAIIQNEENEIAKPMKILKITWLEPCQLCGFSEYLNVTTEKGNDRLSHNEDEVNCPNCGNTGEILCDDNAAAVNWHTELPF